MRNKLEKLEDVRGTFTGIFTRMGKKTSFGYPKTTVLLTDIKDSEGRRITDHLWFNLTKGFEALCLKPMDRVQFDARVKPYLKGYRGYRDDVYDSPVELDYKLSHPTKLQKL
jgi:hypothetical protein